MIDRFYAYLLAQDEITRSLILSGITMAADVLILAMLLPLFLSYLETRKWKPIRSLLAVKTRQWVGRMLKEYVEIVAGERPGLTPPFEVAETRVPETVRLLSVSMTPEFSRILAGIVTYADELETSITYLRHLLDDLSRDPFMAGSFHYGAQLERVFRELIDLAPTAMLLEAEAQRGNEAQPAKALAIGNRHFTLVKALADRMLSYLPDPETPDKDPYERTRAKLTEIRQFADDEHKRLLRMRIAEPKGLLARLRGARGKRERRSPKDYVISAD